MPEEFEGDLAGAVFWGADLRGARFRDVNLADVTISHAWLVGVDIDAYVEGVVINGVDVTAFVNEHDPWYPLRTVLGASNPERMRASWPLLVDAWNALIERAGRLPGDRVHASVGGEWSFVQTLRHLVFAMDKWFTDPILGEPMHTLGLPNTGSIDLPWPDIDRDAAPSLAEVLDVRTRQSARLADYLATLSADDLARSVDVPENGPHHVRDCIATVFEEEFWHARYADRDLTALESAT